MARSVFNLFKSTNNHESFSHLNWIFSQFHQTRNSLFDNFVFQKTKNITDNTKWTNFWSGCLHYLSTLMLHEIGRMMELVETTFK